MGKELSVPSLFQLGYYWNAKIFLTSVRLDLYTAISEGAKTAEEIAAAVRADPSFLRRMLDALVEIGLLKREGPDYLNTPPVAEFLVRTSPFYMGELMLLQDEEWNHWGKLEEIIRSGQPAVKGNIFMNRPEVGENVLKVLHRMAKRVAPTLAERIDLSSYKSFIDVGGGAGTFSVAFCQRYPHLHAVLFDLAQTLQVTRKTLESEKMTNQIQLVGGNFNQDALPGTYDVVFLSDILHYQTFDENAALFRKLYQATNPGGMIIVKDMFINDDVNNPGWNAIFSMHMLVYSEKGQCYKGEEIRSWLEKAGFKNINEIERNTVLTASR
ncbi:MAG: methyltransferase [Nitrospira sp.]|nr:methyltransferase domain-containing protein [Candidatus Manganitrophaceae bacterium]HIL35195.1 methyltransferase domain-containing protein [Candidatus Manganitrophaceae bacterium]